MFSDTIDEDYLRLNQIPNFQDNLIKTLNEVTNFTAKESQSLLNTYFSKDSEDFQQIWRTSGVLPERPTYFYQHYPKKATSLDGEYHSLDQPDITRWIPLKYLKYIVPALSYELAKPKKLTARPVPTSEEVNMCSELKGEGIWNRTGMWTCVVPNSKMGLAGDQYGDKYFNSFSSWVSWRHHMHELIATAQKEDDFDKVMELRKASSPPRIPDSITANRS